MSVRLPVCLSVRLPVRLSVFLSICLSVCLSIEAADVEAAANEVARAAHLSVLPKVKQAEKTGWVAYLSVCLSACLSVSLSV